MALRDRTSNDIISEIQTPVEAEVYASLYVDGWYLLAIEDDIEGVLHSCLGRFVNMMVEWELRRSLD